MIKAKNTLMAPPVNLRAHRYADFLSDSMCMSGMLRVACPSSAHWVPRTQGIDDVDSCIHGRARLSDKDGPWSHGMVWWSDLWSRSNFDTLFHVSMNYERQTVIDLVFLRFHIIPIL